MNDSLPTMHAPLLIDVAGTTLKPYERERLRHPLVGGVTLFARNWADRNQLTRLCQAIKRARPDALIAVDHEGGRVQRFRTDGFTELPAMRRLGRIGVKPKALAEQAKPRYRPWTWPRRVVLCWRPSCVPAAWT